ncbi:TetR-like C-terminal domain-containing protein [Paenibacillus sp. Leaf72]|uniref:TetR-like C-terminal domain-containing protein n=1 Tax=Paenibacillus sp. Leaf72 TaxID=1736234 RepID=UPI000AFCCD1D|nr:TetR-like C-terminal domain-containing protein [Paenibacillus sp. Leaf72]
MLKQYLLRLIKEWGTEYENSESPNIVASLFGHYKKHKDSYLMLYRSGLSYLVLDNIKAVCGPKPDQEDLPAYFSDWFAGALFGWIDEWITRGMKQEPEEMARLLEEVDRRSKAMS